MPGFAPGVAVGAGPGAGVGVEGGHQPLRPLDPGAAQDVVVRGVADHRMAHVLEVPADLVAPAGLRLRFHQGIARGSVARVP